MGIDHEYMMLNEQVTLVNRRMFFLHFPGGYAVVRRLDGPNRFTVQFYDKINGPDDNPRNVFHGDANQVYSFLCGVKEVLYHLN